MFTRILGRANEALCVNGRACPAVMEMTTGDYAVIGEDITEVSRNSLPVGAGCGPGERIVRVPRRVMADARAEIAQVV